MLTKVTCNRRIKCSLSSSEFLEAGRLEFGEARKTCATFPMCCILSSEFRICFILRFRALKWSKSSNSQPDLTRILGLGKLILAIWKFCDFFRVVVKIFNPRSRWTKLKPHLRDLCLWKTQIFAQFAIENGDLLTRPRPNFHVILLDNCRFVFSNDPPTPPLGTGSLTSSSAKEKSDRMSYVKT